MSTGRQWAWVSISQALKCLEKPCLESHFGEQLWRSSGCLVLLYSVPSYGEQSCGSVLWLCSNASLAHQGQKRSGCANAPCLSRKNPLSSVPHFVLCSSNTPATCGADLTAWSNDVLVQPVLSHIAAYTLQPSNTASVPPFMTHTIFLGHHLFFCKVLSNIQ